MLLRGHEEDPEPLAAAWFRLLGSDTIRIAQGTFLGLLDVPGRDEDLAFGT